ncbi:MAG TPA: hypothetical protein VF133_03280 [Terriglobales bacterium]
MFYLLHSVLQFIRLRAWVLAILSSAICIAATCVRIFESKATREQRLRQRKTRELRALANQIATYGRHIRQRFPEGAVIVSEGDLAQQLRKSPEPVANALNVLLKEQKVQRTKLSGYWRLNA